MMLALLASAPSHSRALVPWFSTGQQRINKHTPHLAPRRQTLLMGPVGGEDTAAAAAVLKRELEGAPSRPAPLPRWDALANRRGTKRHG